MNNLVDKLMSLPPLASKHGADVDRLLYFVHGLMAVLFVIWIAYFFYVLWRFRAAKNPKADHIGVTGHTSTWLEVGVAAFEGFLLLGLAIPLWAKVVSDFPKESEATVIRVTAQQFAWNTRYPGKDGVFGKQDINLVTADNKFGLVADDPAGKDDVTPALNDFSVPVDKPVILHLTSMDVIHSFACHPLRVTQDAIPGISIPTHFIPTKVGKYQVTCAQLCGNSHYFMKGFFNVLPQAEFDKWIAEKSKAGGATFE